jgi:hypothetical protein
MASELHDAELLLKCSLLEELKNLVRLLASHDVELPLEFFERYTIYDTQFPFFSDDLKVAYFELKEPHFTITYPI